MRADGLMDRIFVECSALGFQTVLTILLAFAFLWLWHRQRRPYFLTWALAWTLYAARLAFMSAFLVRGQRVWLFAHQACTDLVALLLLLAALQFSRGLPWRRAYLGLGVLGVAWAYLLIFRVGSMAAAGVSAALLLSLVTLWTSLVFWRHQRATGSASARMLAWTFLLWGVHHLDYPLLRHFGTAIYYTVFVDVLIIVAVTIGIMFLVLGEERHQLSLRSAQLEQLTRLLMRAQEDERRRIARELHDEAGQVLTAVKIELDLDGRKDASEMVGRALAQVRDLSNLLRPSVLDDLGLLAALRGMAEDFARRTHIEVRLDLGGDLRGFTPEQEVVVYRVVQEALTNVARHAGARRALVSLSGGDHHLRLSIEDDGRGLAGEPRPQLGLLGMRERVAALGGTLSIATSPSAGFRVEALIPTGVTA
jgi:signal transduction histidine kinase